MAPNMKVTIKPGKKKVKVSSDGLIYQHLKDSFTTTILRVTVFTFGLTKENMTVNGKTIKCTVKEFSVGKMAEYTVVVTSKIRKKVMVNSNGQTEELIKDNGKTESKMAKENISEVKV
jgi:hypothetical protein